MNTLARRGIHTLLFTAAPFIRAKTLQQPKCPSTGERMKKKQLMCTMEYYSAIEKDEMMPFVATWIDLEIIVQSEVSQIETIPHDIIYMWNPKYDTYLQNRNRLTERTDL